MANIAKETETISSEGPQRDLITNASGKLHGVSPSSLKEWRTSEGRTCLHVAVLAGDPGRLGELAAKLPELIEETDNQGDTPLHLSVRIYRVDMVKQLLDKGADLRDCENRTWEGRTILHFAVMAGDSELLREIARKLPVLMNKKDNRGDTALHLALSIDRVDLVKQLLDRGADLRDCENRTWEGRTILHVAVMAGDSELLRKIARKLPVLMNKEDNDGKTALHLALSIYRVDLVKQLIKLAKKLNLKADWLDCVNKTWEGRTTLHIAVMAGDSELLGEITRKLSVLMNKSDNDGDTALHLAVRIYRLDLVKKLLESDTDLCNCKNRKQETPLDIAIKLQFVEAVEVLIPCTKNALEGENNLILHLVVSFNQANLLEVLIKFSKGKLSKLINLPYKPATNPTQPENSNNEDSRAVNPQHIQPLYTAMRNIYEHDKRASPGIVPGDTPLHVAARHKYERMVNLLLQVPMVNKHACNSEGKTPLDIAREVTQYYECFRIIKRLRDDPPKGKPFMYCEPQVSHKKNKKAMKRVKKAFEERRNSELVVAVLLATMTFTAAITVPGGFNSDTEEEKKPGSPILIPFTSFKLFLIFDCIAFFLSLFVCIMWEMSSELTTGDKMFFMTINSFVVCCSFGFTAFGFMAAVYAMLVLKVKTFAWEVLGSLLLITLCGAFASIYQSARFAVSRARFLRLCGAPHLVDDLVERVWRMFECCGFLDILRSLGDKIRGIVIGQLKPCSTRTLGGSGHDRTYNCSIITDYSNL